MTDRFIDKLVEEAFLTVQKHTELGAVDLDSSIRQIVSDTVIAVIAEILTVPKNPMTGERNIHIVEMKMESMKSQASEVK